MCKNIARLDARICKGDVVTGVLLAAMAAAAFTFVRFVAVDNAFVAGGTSTEDNEGDDDWTARPLHLSACSLDI